MLLDPTDQRPVHFVGIAGAGMSALAELFVRRGVKVTGCDAVPVGVDDLRRLGIEIHGGHDPSHVTGARALVVTSAMPKNHPEMERARQAGIPVIRRAEALGEATSGDGRELVGVAGTHGKSTTTVLTAEALGAAGRDPTALVGARVSRWDGNLRAGGDRLYVVEADEYDRSFLTLTPTVAIVTNVEADHLDIYKDLADIRGAFSQFIAGARTIVLCADDPGASTLPTPSTTEVIRYGVTSPDARLRALNVRSQAGGGVAFSVEYDGELLGAVALKLAGTHNVLNALAAVAAGLALGAPFTGLAYGLANVLGAERRFQQLGERGGITVIDDYAHHPTEIAATLSAARSMFPGRRLVVAFQPHLYSRTRDFAREFATALSAGDSVYLTEIYAAREQPISGVSADLIAVEFGERDKLAWRGERAVLADALARQVRAGDVVITMGAGDITRTGPELLARIGGTAEERSA